MSVLIKLIIKTAGPRGSSLNYEPYYYTIVVLEKSSTPFLVLTPQAHSTTPIHKPTDRGQGVTLCQVRKTY